VALRGYLRLTVLDAATWEPVATAALPLQPQGETIALGEDPGVLLVGSEGRGSLVQAVEVPELGAGAGTPSSTARPTSPTSSARREPVDPATAAREPAEEWLRPELALMAGAVALVGVVWRVRRARSVRHR
jgi:hypothetical protein